MGLFGCCLLGLLACCTSLFGFVCVFIACFFYLCSKWLLSLRLFVVSSFLLFFGWMLVSFVGCWYIGELLMTMYLRVALWFCLVGLCVYLFALVLFGGFVL